jgi:hypothetical protein
MVFRAENGHVSSGNSCFAPFDEAFEMKNGLLLLVLPFANSNSCVVDAPEPMKIVVFSALPNT